jgi:hypothetical protein
MDMILHARGTSSKRHISLLPYRHLLQYRFCLASAQQTAL